MSEEPTVRVMLGDEVSSPLTLRELHDRWERGEVTRATPMWSERWQEWTTVSEAMAEMYPQDKPSVRLEEMKENGVSIVEVLGTGDERDCAQCRMLQARAFDIDAAPALPPPGCTCEPWCRCLYVAKEASQLPGRSGVPALPEKVLGLTTPQWLGYLGGPLVAIFAVSTLWHWASGNMAEEAKERTLAKQVLERAEAQREAERAQGKDAYARGRLRGANDAVTIAAQGTKPTVAVIRATGLVLARTEGVADDLHGEFMRGYERGFRDQFKAQVDW